MNFTNKKHQSKDMKIFHHVWQTRKMIKVCMKDEGKRELMTYLCELHILGFDFFPYTHLRQVYGLFKDLQHVIKDMMQIKQGINIGLQLSVGYVV